MASGNSVTGDEFAKRMSAIAEKLPTLVVQIKQKLALDILKRVVMMTPVDTGRARNNWLVGINHGPSGTLGTGKRDADRAAFGGIRGSLGSATGGIARESKTVVTAKLADQIWLSNNLPYIQALNSGTSKQIPEKFVERAIKEAIAPLKSGTLRLKL